MNSFVYRGEGESMGWILLYIGGGAGQGPTNSFVYRRGLARVLPILLYIGGG